MCSASSTTSSRSLSAGAGSSASFGASASPQPRRVGRRLAQRHRPAPRGAADEPRPEGELPRRAPRAFRSCEQAVDEHPEPSPERQLVADRFRELERLVEGLGRPSRRDPPVLLTSRQAPGAPAVRPQPFGDGAARQPGKLSDRSYSQLFELLVAVALEREQRQRQRREERARAVVGDDQRLPRPRDVRRGERREAPLGRARARASQAEPDRRERPLERRLEPAVEPLDALRLEEDRARLGRLDREAGVLEPPQDLLPRLLDGRRVLLDELELRAGRERLAEAHPRPDALRLRRPP